MNLQNFAIVFFAGMCGQRAISSFSRWRDFLVNAKGITLTSTDPKITLESITLGYRNEAIWAALVCAVLIGCIIWSHYHEG